MRPWALAALLAWPASAHAAAGPANSGWAMLYANPQRTSSTTFSGPARPKIAFAVLTGGNGMGGYGVSIGADGGLFTPINESGIGAFNSDGTPRWTYDAGMQKTAQPPVTSDGKVIFRRRDGGLNGGFVALNQTTGAQAWSLLPACNGNESGGPNLLLSPAGNVYGGGAGGGAHCFDAVTSDGAFVWGGGNGNFVGDATLSPDGARVYHPQEVNTLRARNALTGADIWSIAVPNPGISGITLPAIGGDGTIYLHNFATLFAHNPDNSLRWSVATPSFLSAPVVAGSTVVAVMGSFNDRYFIRAYNAANGGALWSFAVNDDLFATPISTMGALSLYKVGNPSIGGDTVFFTLIRGDYTSPAQTFLVALDSLTGKKKWLIPAPQDGEENDLGQAVPTATNLYYSNGRSLLSFVESTASTFTVTASTTIMIPGGAGITFTANVRDAFDAPVSSVPVFFEAVGISTINPMSGGGYTDASGNFSLTFTSVSANSSIVPSTFSVRAYCLDFSTKDIEVEIEGEVLDHYAVEVPTKSAVGVPFDMKVFARNNRDHGLPFYPGASGPSFVNLTPFLAGTEVAGIGFLGRTFAQIISGTGTVTGQTYNKIESIQIKASQSLPGLTVGISTAIAITGPDHFIISLPTAGVAGQQFPMTVSAVDPNDIQLIGYTGTLSLTPVVWNSTGQTGSGQLSVTNVNMAVMGQITIANQTYNRGEGIRIKGVDSSLDVEGISSSMTVTQPASGISHYGIAVPTQVTVGLPFSMQINALDVSSAPVTYSLDRALNIQALLSGAGISGSGSLGNSAVTLSAGSTHTVVNPQTYNKIEAVQLKVIDDDGRIGVSSPIAFSGPTTFDVTVPTSATAGTSFRLIVVARDGSGQQALGYNATVNLSAVKAATTSLSGAGILGVTSLNIGSGLGITDFESYTKAEDIRVRVADSALDVTVFSSSMTVSPGPAASLALSANPQSTIASVPSVLTATIQDLFSNPVTGSTVTFSVAQGSGVVSVALTNGAVAGSAISTNAVTDSLGRAQAFFGSSNTVSSQADLVRASIGGLTSDTTVYNAVLITPAGGTVVNIGNNRIKATVPANSWGFNVRFSAQGLSELSASEVALTTTALAKFANTFISTSAAKFTAVKDSNPASPAGKVSSLMSVELPFDDDGNGNVTVGSLRPSNLLVPLSVLRIFRLNQATSVFEMVLNGANLPNLGSRTVAAQVTDPDGIYAVGAPAFTEVSATSSGTVTTSLASGATVSVEVPAGVFPEGTSLSVSVPSESSVPALSAQEGLTGTGLTVSIEASGGAQPSAPVRVAIGYKASDVAGLNPETLKIARYGVGKGWEVLSSQVDAANNSVSAYSEHFSLFTLVAVSAGDLSQGFAFPNPFRPSQGHTKIKFSNLPAAAHIKIYTPRGRLLRELDADLGGQVLTWDGTDDKARPLASGVYLAVLESQGKRRVIKFAVQR